jgi:aspartyl-tRNA(Asn)/glutamyl-tRNA(Gln) amidotransferase subunit A
MPTAKTYPETQPPKTAPSSIVDRTEVYLATIKAREPILHAIAELFEDEALQQANQLDSGNSTFVKSGPLYGMPFLVKELLDVAGHVTRFGSTVYAQKAATVDATAIQRLKEEGAVLLGTTRMVEFAYGSWGTNYIEGTPWNPSDPVVHRAPGGSSSGSAVAVAAGLVPLAVGSDTGGSIRIPATLCGAIGFKPTYGLIPTDGVAPLGPTFDTLGPITRTVSDARRATEAMAARDLSHSEVPLSEVRFAILCDDALSPCAPEVMEAVEQAMAILRSCGAAFDQIDLPAPLVEFQKLNGDIVGFEAYAHLRHLAEDWRTTMDPYVRRRILGNGTIDQATYDARLTQLAAWRADFSQTFTGHDILILPGTPLCAPPLTEVNEAEIPMSRYTRVANCLDLCAISLPLPRSADQLPVGLQLCARANADAYLLAVANSVLEAISTLRAT